MPLTLAAEPIWNEAMVWSDGRKTYNEDRKVAIAPIGNRLCVCVFTDRGDVRRVISLRKANLREYKLYET